MAKKLQLQVPTPCHENWENMTQTEKGKFCASCQKQVIDFSSQSDREIAMFFKKPSTGSVCGRFMGDQLNRDIDIPGKRIPWLKYFFKFLIPAFFISYRATAQGKVKVVSNVTTQPQKLSNERQYKNLKGKIAEEVCSETVGESSITLYNNSSVATKEPKLEFDNSCKETLGLVSSPNLDAINGKIIDEDGRPIPSATIVIRGTKYTAVADADGLFNIYLKTYWENISLVALSVGFTATEVKINRLNYSPDTIITIPMKAQATGEVVVVGFTVNKKIKKKPVPLLQRIFKDTAFSKLRIYPNPIRSNSILTIEWKQKDYGDQLIQLFNQSGQLVFSREINIREGTRSFSINMPPALSGNYFLKLTSKATGRSYTEKLIVN